MYQNFDIKDCLVIAKDIKLQSLFIQGRVAGLWLQTNTEFFQHIA